MSDVETSRFSSHAAYGSGLPPLSRNFARQCGENTAHRRAPQTFAGMMKKLPAVMVPLCLCLLSTGCADSFAGLGALFKGPSTEVKHSAITVDDEAKNYYEHQILDNLVRVANGQFFIQTDLNDIGAVIEWRVAGNVQAGRTGVNTSSSQSSNQLQTANEANATGSSQTVTNVPFLNPAGGVGGVATAANPNYAKTATTTGLGVLVQNVVTGTAGLVASTTSAVTRPFSASLSPEHDNTLTMNAAPVVQDPNIANAYIEYLNLPRKRVVRPWYNHADFYRDPDLHKAPGFQGHPDELIEELRNGKDPLATFLWGNISDSDQKKLLLTPNTQQQRATDLARVLNSILQGPSIYKLERFQGFRLCDDTFVLLSKQPQLATKKDLPPQGPTGDDVFLLNRLLLEDYFRKDGKKYVAELPREQREPKYLPEKEDLKDFDYETKSPDAVTKLEKRTRGFDLCEADPSKDNGPQSIRCFKGSPDELMRQMKNAYVRGIFVTVTHNRFGKIINVDEKGVPQHVYPNGIETYYIPKEYANAFFHLCATIVSRVPAKTGGSQTSKSGIQPSLPIR